MAAAGGGVVGSATPDGQCQWSPWDSHVEPRVVTGIAESMVETSFEAVAEAPTFADWDGGVVASATPEGQCLEERLGQDFLLK